MNKTQGSAGAASCIDWRPSRLHRALIAVAMVSGVLATLPAHANSVVGATPEDLALANSVQAALLTQSALRAPDVDIVVRVSNGKVNLSGWIDDVSDEALARKVAVKVPGVKTVSTNLRSWSTDGIENTSLAPGAAPRGPSVFGATSADLALASNVQAALMNEQAFQSGNVDIIVRAAAGKVNLSGWINDAGDDLLARKVAASVSGVKSVSMNFRSWSTDGNERAGAGPAVTAMPAAKIIGATADDIALATSVRSALMQTRQFQDPDVDLVVRASQGKVNVSGWVSYASNEQLARKVARTVPGVKVVSTDLRSWSSEVDPRR